MTDKQQLLALAECEDIARLLHDWRAFKRRINPLNWFRRAAMETDNG